jgi:zinc protease
MAALMFGAAAGDARAQAVAWPTERPPRPLPARDAKFPSYEIRTLANGLQVVAVLHHEQPVVAMRLLVRAGAAHDPSDKAGVATLAASLLDQGTTTRSARQIAEAIDSIGGALGAGAGTDLSFVNVVVMKDSFAFGMELLSDIVRNPVFAPEEIERQRQQMLSGLRVSYDDPDYVAGVVFDRLVYGFHPYGMPNSGTPESIARVARDDLRAFHQAHFAPNNAVLAIVGDVTAAEAFSGVERVFGSWARKEVPPASFIDPPEPTRRVVVVDKPGAVQSEIRVGHLGIPRKHDDYMALNLAVRILGGEGSNRLYRVLRSERGLTYGASADMETLKESGDIVAETDTRSQASAEALRLIVDEFSTIRRERVGERELAEAKAYMTGSFPLTIETPDAIAMQVLNALFYGLDLKDLETFRERVNAVSVDDVQRVAQAYLKPDRLSVVLVGDASTFADALAGIGFAKHERVPLTELDLTAADFRRGSRADGNGSPEPAKARPSPSKAEIDRARQLISRAIEAKGGLEKLRSVKTVSAAATTTLVTPDGPVEARTVTYIEYPDRFRVEATLPMGEVVQTYADGEAWVRNAMGVQDAPPEMRDDFRRSVKRDVIALLLEAASGRLPLRPLPGAGDGTLEGVEISSKETGPIQLFIDPATGMIVRQSYVTAGSGDPQRTDEMFSDYRSVDGLQVAFKAQLKRGGATIIERTVTEYRYNVPLQPALFKKP